MADFDALAVLHAVAGPVMVADREDLIVYANPAAERLFAGPGKDLRKRPLEGLLPERLRGRRPGLFRTLLGQGSSPTRVHALRADGVELDIEVSVGEAGPLLVTCVHQIREQPKVPADERYRLVFDNAPVGILHWDEKGVITDCNAAMLQILGSPKEMVIGLNLLTLHGDPSREKVASLVRGTLQGTPGRFEGRYTSTAQKTTHLESLLAPLHGPSGVAGGVAIVEDVSERRRIQTALARTDRMASIGTLAAGVAHDSVNATAVLMLIRICISPPIAAQRQTAA